MATSATPLPLPVKAQEAVIQYLKAACDLTNSTFNIREQLLARDRAYYREEDQTTEHQRAKAANAAGDSNKMQNYTVPVVMPQVESALAYLAETFLTGYPIFGVVAPPKYADALGAMETLIGENSIRAGWPAELMKVLRDGLKYDLGCAEVTWQKKTTFAIGTPEITKTAVGTVSNTIWEGNVINWRSPYNLILDTRVAPELNHLQGEFAGYVEMISRIEAKKRMKDLPLLGTMNFRAGFESATPGLAGNSSTDNYYMPDINPNALLSVQSAKSFSWANWAGLDAKNGKDPIAYKDSYQWTVLYARIIPADLGLVIAAGKDVQIWKFIFMNNSVVIFAERQTNAHANDCLQA
jgi:hypothetical protein